MGIKEIWNYIVEHKIGALAIYGALISTISLGFNFYLNNKDEAKIKVNYKKDREFFGDPQREGKIFTIITVTNHGRRPVKIEQVFYRYFSGMSFILVDSFNTNKQRILTEENPTVSFFSEQSEIDFNQVWYVGAYDAKNIEYKLFIASWPRRIWETMKRPFNKNFKN